MHAPERSQWKGVSDKSEWGVCFSAFQSPTEHSIPSARLSLSDTHTYEVTADRACLTAASWTVCWARVLCAVWVLLLRLSEGEIHSLTMGSVLGRYYLTCFLYYTCLWLQSWTSSTAGASAQLTTVDDLSLSKSLWNELDMISSAISSGRLSPINTKRGGREWRKSFIFDEEQCSKMKAGFGAYAVIGSTFSQQEQ